MVALGNPAQAASIYEDGRRTFRLEFEQIDSKFHYLLFVLQAETKRVLREALAKAGVTIERNVAIIAFAQAERDTDVTAVLQRPDGSLERLECAYMIEADGAHSTARETFGLQFQGKSLVADYALGDLHVHGDLPVTDLDIFSSEYGLRECFRSARSGSANRQLSGKQAFERYVPFNRGVAENVQ